MQMLKDLAAPWEAVKTQLSDIERKEDEIILSTDLLPS
jgi:hypothetical protein